MLPLDNRAGIAMMEPPPTGIPPRTRYVYRPGGHMVPVPGGVLIREASGALLGAIGVSGDTSDNDELCAVEALRGAGLVPDTGAEDA